MTVLLRNVPNILTALRILLTPVFIYCVLTDGWEAAALTIFVFASITDWYDGYLARKHGYSTDWGRFLDPLADKILVVAAFSTFVYLGLIKLWMVVIIVLRDSLITLLRSYAMRSGKPMMTNLFGKMKTVLQMFMIGLVLVFVSLESQARFSTLVHPGIVATVRVFSEYHVIYSGMLFVTFITALSGIVYIYQNRDNLRNIPGVAHFRQREL